MMRRKLASLAVLLLAWSGGLAAAPPPSPPPPTAPVNLGFEEGEVGQMPAGWSMPATSVQEGYGATLVTDRPESGARCVRITRQGPPRQNQVAGILSQAVDVAPYRGKRVRYRAALRLAGDFNLGGEARLWLRVERPGGLRGAFDNMDDRPVTSAQWGRHEIVFDVARDATALFFGAMLLRDGEAFVDSASLEVIGDAGMGNEPARPLAGRGLENLTAFARLLGYVRYFHPSDQAAAADWNRLALAGIQAVEGARDARDLAARLESFFRPVAPTVRVFPSGATPAPVDFARPADPDPKRVAWRHFGVGLRKPHVYSSRRIDSRADPQESAGLPRPEEVFRADLGGGVSAAVPLVLYADDRGTLPVVPAADARPPAPDKPEGFLPSGNDRATRLANIVLAWNVFQHFYPYFDVVATDWPATLRRSLEAAAQDADEVAYLGTLERLVADLQDGHGRVTGPGGSLTRALPLAWEWIEDQLVVTHAHPEKAAGIERGSVVLRIDGKPAREAVLEAERHVSGATPGWRRSATLSRLRLGGADQDVKLEVRAPSGQVSAVTLRRGEEAVVEPRPEKISEVRPGILYVDLDRVQQHELTPAVLERLAAARGIVFDVRGYPKVMPTFLGHLIDQPVESARWEVPVALRPDREGVVFEKSGWPVEPAAPRLRGKVAFLTNGRAISYAETFLGIVEAYKLGEIVGAPTAGTNGNVNTLNLPGGSIVSWTGMRVRKHDGSRLHGVGVLPTVPAARTLAGVIAGRDEVLEKGIEVVSR